MACECVLCLSQSLSLSLSLKKLTYMETKCHARIPPPLTPYSLLMAIVVFFQVQQPTI